MNGSFFIFNDCGNGNRQIHLNDIVKALFFIFNRHIISYMDARIYKYFSPSTSQKEAFFNIFVVLTVRFRTQNVRFRTLLSDLINAHSFEHQIFISLAYFL